MATALRDTGDVILKMLRLLPILIVMFMVSCSREPLPGGVKKIWLSGGYHSLVRTINGIEVGVVSADVQWVKVKGSLIYGVLKEYQYTDGVSSKAGYFILDTITWKVTEGLSKEDASKVLGLKL